MARLRYISHADVVIEPAVPVPRWHLSDVGVDRVMAMLDQPWVATIGRVVTSSETKAVETGRILARHRGLEIEVRPDTGENDRSATGFVPPDEFERLADAFFARPDLSTRGWEPARAAQSRVATALADLVASDEPFDIAVVGHGGVGTLWYCHLAGLAIDRRHDQPGQGHYYTIDRPAGRVLHSWRPIDDLES